MDKSDARRADFKLYRSDISSLEKAITKCIKYCECASDW